MKNIVLVVMFMLIYNFASAQNRDMGMGMMGMMGMMGEHMEEMVGACLVNADKLKLSDDQIKKLQPIHREIQKKQIKFRSDIKLTELELVEVMDVKDFDLAKATELTKKITDLRFAHHSELLTLMKEVRTTLTEEQFQKMKKMKAMDRMMMPAKKNPQQKHMKH